jgi:xylulokinase
LSIPIRDKHQDNFYRELVLCTERRRTDFEEPPTPFAGRRKKEKSMRNSGFLTTSEPVVLGIDVGTTGAKCAFYTKNGIQRASAYQEYPMIHPQGGWVEEDPGRWWSAVAANIRRCFDSGAVTPSQVAAVGVSCTNAVIPLDKDGNHLYNAILQLDQRTEGEVEWVIKNIGKERICRVTGNRIARGTFSLPTLRWYMNKRPDIVKKTHKFVVPSGFIIHKLTGNFSINTSRMGFTLLSDIRSGAWDEDLARDAGVPVELLPAPYQATDIIGSVNRQAASLTGLLEGTSVVAGAMDTVAAAVGAGAVRAGDTFLAVGTCGRLCFAADKPVFDDRLMHCRHAVEGLWLTVEATNASGASLRWFRDVFGGAVLDRCARGGKDIYAVMDDLAAESVPGAGGLIYLPYLSGERCPIWDPNARGVFFGLHFGTAYADMVRAVFEGVVYSIRQGMDIVLEHNSMSENLTLGGGIANSLIWSQMFADILDHPIIRLNVHETETLGGAILAAYGVGLISDMGDMARDAAKGSEVLMPDRRAAAVYKEYFPLFRKLYGDLKDDFALLQEVSNPKAHSRFYG